MVFNATFNNISVMSQNWKELAIPYSIFVLDKPQLIAIGFAPLYII